MADKKRQHYVPQFYLRRFSSNGDQRSINLFNINRGKCIVRSSISGQCYENFFYGEDGLIEGELSKLEGAAAVYLKLLEDTKTKPKPFTEGFDVILMFLAMQRLRTAAAADHGSDMTDKAMKKFLEKDHRVTKEMLDSVKIGYDNPVLQGLGIVHFAFACMYDLRWKLLVNTTDRQFVTSDHPVVTYNQFQESERLRSTTGYVQRGLKLLFPLSPSTVLLLYDETIYRIGARGQLVHEITTTADVDQINRLQFVSAYKNVFFERAGDASYWERFAEEATKGRVSNAAKVDEFMGQATGSRRSSLLVIGRHEPKIKLNLTFLWTHLNERRHNHQLGSMQVRSPRFCSLLEAFNKADKDNRKVPSRLFDFMRRNNGLVPAAD